MTRIAILSDIHGNTDALAAVLSDVRAHGAGRLFICGDITGYYYDTAEVWKVLRDWDCVMCRGNHEVILSRWIHGSRQEKEEIEKKYGSSYRIAVEAMPTGDLNTLLSLDHPEAVTVDDVRFVISHGAPWDENAYLYPDMNENSRQRILDCAREADVVLMGHTHYQLSIAHEGFLAINAGSVGQPRSGKPSGSMTQSRAQWALYDTRARTHRLMTSYYDPSRLFAQVDRYDPHLPYLKAVLTRQEVAA